MKEEIGAAVSFLSNLVNLQSSQVKSFEQILGSLLMERFEGHWFPEKPFKGQAYRCIRVNEAERKDPVLEKAAEMCGLPYENLNLPVELTIWVDPHEVCCRFGEQEGSFCTVASFKESNKENIQEFVKKSRRKVDRPKKKMCRGAIRGVPYVTHSPAYYGWHPIRNHYKVI